MLILIKNFLKASFRDRTFIFFDWIFPLILIGGITLLVKGKEYTTFFLPSLIAFLILQNLIYALPLRIAQFKENRVMRLVAEEKSVGLFLISFFIVRIIMVAIQTLIFIPLGVILMSIQVSINMIWLLIGFLMSLLSIGGLSILVATLPRNERSAYGWAQIFYILLTAISGIFYPLEKSPLFLKIVAQISPLAYSREILAYGINGSDSAKVPFYAMTYLLVFGVLTLFVGIFIIYKDSSLRRGRSLPVEII